MKNVKISIIVPIYNMEQYIGETIESVLKQTMSDWELILVNDGSNDRSLDICRDYATHNVRIKVIDCLIVVFRQLEDVDYKWQAVNMLLSLMEMIYFFQML